MFVVAPVQRANIGDHFRAFGLRGQAALIDPFLNVDHAWMSAPTFAPHPHAGFSAVSYVFEDSETAIHNLDSLGTDNLIRPGGLHWITAGKGVVHREDPVETGKAVHSLQIFVALPTDRQDCDPFPLTLEPENVPSGKAPGVSFRVPLGRFGDLSSPLTPPTDVTLIDASLETGAELIVPIEARQAAFVMPIAGVVEVEGRSFDREALILPVFRAQGEPQTIALRAPHGGAQVVVFKGTPFH